MPIIYGDALKVLKTLPSEHVQTCITSPPYWQQRDYGVEDQYGLEPSIQEHIDKLVEVFREVKRVLRNDGTLWVNYSDSYATNSIAKNKVQGNPEFNKNRPSREKTLLPAKHIPANLKPKNLIGLPWRLAFALQADGWYLRSDIIWAKKNCMPESATDRPTKSHEYIFLLSKRPRYFYDNDAIRENYAENAQERLDSGVNIITADIDISGGAKLGKAYNRPKTYLELNPLGRNKWSVWNVATEAFSGAHYATFPRKLIEPCVLAGTSPQACEHCLAPWKRIVKTSGGTIGQAWHDHKNDMEDGNLMDTDKLKKSKDGSYKRETISWQPTCKCENNTGIGRCIVFDPFIGSGTTAEIAMKAGRDYLGIELDRRNEKFIRQRLGLYYAD
jgi:DNA modification methylase